MQLSSGSSRQVVYDTRNAENVSILNIGSTGILALGAFFRCLFDFRLFIYIYIYIRRILLNILGIAVLEYSCPLMFYFLVCKFAVFSVKCMHVVQFHFLPFIYVSPNCEDTYGQTGSFAFLLKLMYRPLCLQIQHSKPSASVLRNNDLFLTDKIWRQTSGVLRNFVRGWGVGGSTNAIEDKGRRERGSGGGSPLVMGFWRQL